MNTARRLDEQRRRNRLMDLLALLATHNEGVQRVGSAAWRAGIAEWLDDAAPWAWQSWSVFTTAEIDLVTQVQTTMMVSCGEVAGLDDDALVATGWPQRISRLATPALHVMNARGKFAEDVVETAPTGTRVDLHDKQHAPIAEVEIPAGSVVEVTVVCHHPFGLGVWVEEHDQFGHVNVPTILDGPIRDFEDYPRIGGRRRAVVLGYSGSSQLRLSTKPSDIPGLTVRGKKLARQIADAVGCGEVDLDSEHSRWHVYWEAVPREDLRPLLKEVTTEGEELSQQVVTEVLKYVDADEGRAWVGLLRPGDGRNFAERRLREWALIREVEMHPRRIAEDLPDLTLWCQRRLIEHVTSDLVLTDLAEYGTVKKVRHAAREKLRGRWKGWA
jgi:hypothetical protein